MYKLSREKKIIEQIELDGGEVIDINIDVENISNDFNQAYNKVIAAEKKMAELKIKTDNKEVIDLNIERDYGEAVIALFSVVFGEENTSKILNYYENRYIEMSSEVFPFIINVVVPRMKTYMEEKRKKLEDNYLATKNLGKRK